MKHHFNEHISYLYEEGLKLTKELEGQLKAFEEKIESIGKENE